MSGSAKEGILSLLDKPGKDLLRVSNWRPLSLLCSDFKVFAKILANRLQLVIDKLIHQDQAGFIKGRSIANNLMDLNSVLFVAEEKQIESSLIQIDFEKAYDTVNLEAFYATLEAYKFGPRFIEMIKTCHKGIKSYVINDGNFSSEINISRGFRQGCPLSCLCFDLMIELIAIRIRNNENIEGITIGTKQKSLDNMPMIYGYH